MIFEPFSGKPPAKRAVKGSGLGLSIAVDCIRRMQGELYLVDESGQDVCFRIELPSSKTRNNANSLSHQAILFASLAPGSARNSRTTCTLRFLRAVHVQTACNNTPTGIALSLVNMRHIFQRLLPRRLWLAGLPCLALLGCVQSHNKPAIDTPAEEKIPVYQLADYLLLNVATSGRCKVNQPKPIRFTGCGRWIVLIV